MDVRLIIELFNDGWKESWGFIPLAPKEFSSMAKLLKPFVTQDFAFFIELDAKPIGFAVVIPNLHELTSDLGGRLLPCGIFRFLPRMRKGRFR